MNSCETFLQEFYFFDVSILWAWCSTSHTLSSIAIRVQLPTGPWVSDVDRSASCVYGERDKVCDAPELLQDILAGVFVLHRVSKYLRYTVSVYGRSSQAIVSVFSF